MSLSADDTGIKLYDCDIEVNNSDLLKIAIRNSGVIEAVSFTGDGSALTNLTWNNIPAHPTNVSYFTNDANYATQSYVDGKDLSTFPNASIDRYAHISDLPSTAGLISLTTANSLYYLKTNPDGYIKNIQDAFNYNYLTNKPTIPAAQIQSDWNQTTNTSLDYIKNKPTIPAAQVQSDWNAATGMGVILNKPSIPAAQVQSDWNAATGMGVILNKPTIPAAQIQSDWNQTTTTALDYIKNKPTNLSQWTTNSSTNTIYYNSGNVGIGTSVLNAQAYPNNVCPLMVYGETHIFNAKTAATNTTDSPILVVNDAQNAYYFITSSYSSYWNPIVANGDMLLMFGAGSDTGNLVIAPKSASAKGLKILGATGYVGIGTKTPGTALDVIGTVRATAFSGDGSLITNVDYNNIVNWPITVITSITKNYSKAFSTTANTYFDLTSITTTNGAFHVDIALVDSDPSSSLSKKYILPIQYNQTANVWKRCLPIATASTYNTEDFEIFVNVNGSVASFRVYRVGGSVAATFNIIMQIWFDSGNVPSIADSNTASSTDANWSTYGIFSATPLTQKGGSVGIGTASPSSMFEVYGSTTVKNGDSSYTTYGPNATWSSSLRVGASGNNITSSTSLAQVISTNGNLHLDAGSSRSIYLNYYNAGYTNSGSTAGSIWSSTPWSHTSSLSVGGDLTTSGNFYSASLTSTGVANIYTGTRYAVVNGRMKAGSLTIGSITENYGCGNDWSANTAGFMMECADNTEIVIHDSGQRLASFMEYVGGENKFYIGRDMGYGTTSVQCPGKFTVGGSVYASGDYHMFGSQSYQSWGITYQTAQNYTLGATNTTGWIGANIGAITIVTTEERVVIGTLNGHAQIGAHNAALNAWATLYINQYVGGVASDSNIKTNIHPADNTICYNTIKNLPLIRYSYDSNIVPGFITEDKTLTGILAQDMEKYFPKSVRVVDSGSNLYSIDGYKSIDVSQVHYTMIGAVKELMNRNEEQKIIIDNLLTRIIALEAKV